MFTEKPRLHDMNRRLSKESKIIPAQLSDGSRGAAYYYGNRLLVLSAEEAISVATRLVEAITTETENTK